MLEDIFNGSHSALSRAALEGELHRAERELKDLEEYVTNLRSILNVPSGFAFKDVAPTLLVRRSELGAMHTEEPDCSISKRTVPTRPAQPQPGGAMPDPRRLDLHDMQLPRVNDFTSVVTVI